MNHLESAFTGKNNFWRYLVMITAVFLASNTIGALPLLTGILIKSLLHPGAASIFSAGAGGAGLMDFEPNLMLMMMLFPFIAALGVFIYLVKPLHGRSIWDVINGTRKIRWNRFFISLLIWLGLSALYFFVYLKIAPEDFSLNNTGLSLLYLSVITIALIPFQAAFEEVMFRGYLMQGFSAMFARRWFPLIVTSLLFALMHGMNPEIKEYGFFTMMPQYILFGLIFGVITILDDGIEASVGAHTANNIFLCIMVTSKSSALQTPALYEQQTMYPWIELVALFAVGVIFIFSLKKIFGWKDFSPLTGVVEKPLKSDAVN